MVDHKPPGAQAPRWNKNSFETWGFYLVGLRESTRRKARAALAIRDLADHADSDGQAHRTDLEMAYALGLKRASTYNGTYKQDLINLGLVTILRDNRRPGEGTIYQLEYRTSRDNDLSSKERHLADAMAETASLMKSNPEYRKGSLPTSAAVYNAVVATTDPTEWVGYSLTAITPDLVASVTGMSKGTAYRNMALTRSFSEKEQEVLTGEGAGVVRPWSRMPDGVKDRKGKKLAKMNKEIRRQQETKEALEAWDQCQTGKWSTRLARAGDIVLSTMEPYEVDDPDYDYTSQEWQELDAYRSQFADQPMDFDHPEQCIRPDPEVIARLLDATEPMTKVTIKPTWQKARARVVRAVRERELYRLWRLRESVKFEYTPDDYESKKQLQGAWRRAYSEWVRAHRGIDSTYSQEIDSVNAYRDAA